MRITHPVGQSHGSKEIVRAAIWATNALARREPSQRRSSSSFAFPLMTLIPGTDSNENALRLRALGFESRLREMRDDPTMDVRERVRDTLEMLDTASFRLD
jgi:hypothetical protein